MEIWSKAISYSKRIRAEYNKRETTPQIIQKNPITKYAMMQILILISLMNTRQLKWSWILWEFKGKEAIFRSKSRWIVQGAKPTKYFFNLEKKNYVTKTLLQIKPKNSEITSDRKKINEQIETFFSETY